MKTLQNNFTTPEQSKRLLELGIPADSADCYLMKYRYVKGIYRPKILYDATYSQLNKFTDVFDYLPCWSVGRIIEIICNCHVITNQLTENWIRCNKNTNLIELLIRDIEIYVHVQHMDFSKLEE